MAKTKAKSVKQPPKKKLISKKQVTVHVPVFNLPRPLQGFVDFVREQGVIGLAIGLVLGAAIKTLVDSMVSNIINPVVGLFTGGVNLADKVACLHSEYQNGAWQCTNSISYGKFLSDLLSFIILAAVVYIIFIVLRLDKLDKKPAKK